MAVLAYSFGNGEAFGFTEQRDRGQHEHIDNDYEEENSYPLSEKEMEEIKKEYLKELRYKRIRAKQEQSRLFKECYNWRSDTADSIVSYRLSMSGACKTHLVYFHSLGTHGKNNGLHLSYCQLYKRMSKSEFIKEWKQIRNRLNRKKVKEILAISCGTNGQGTYYIYFICVDYNADNVFNVALDLVNYLCKTKKFKTIKAILLDNNIPARYCNIPKGSIIDIFHNELLAVYKVSLVLPPNNQRTYRTKRAKEVIMQDCQELQGESALPFNFPNGNRNCKRGSLLLEVKSDKRGNITETRASYLDIAWCDNKEIINNDF